MTRVALLWHMHQPFYQDLATGEHILPWVRLHGIKDYWGMAAVVREFPGLRLTFNLVPSLLVQLESYALGTARDRHLDIGLKRADQLTDEERAFCVENFFHAHRPRMIDPYPRYAELLERRGPLGAGLSPAAQASRFSTADLRDLQVWHKLVWIDPAYLESDDRARGLVQKGQGFTEDDKQVLRAIELEILRRVVPEYREAAATGQVELSTSPFYHPILPLLCDTDVYLRAHPDSRMPAQRFQHPEDALEQLARAAALHERLFGRRPAGVWPSEGAVSDDMVPLALKSGFTWMATDEEILARTLGRELTRDARGQSEQPELLYRPYRVGREGATIGCGFRDHTLSDLIGFSYASWAPAAAADDFVNRLVEAGERSRARAEGGEATIFVILDGENAWEHYEGQGRPFLRALYARLVSHPGLRTVTMEEACGPAGDRLPSIFPGSWINGDFYIWIGHRDDHRAWTQLAAARRALDAPGAGATPDALAAAREELLIAEGSDWFWWYGDDHSSSHDAEFDDLFRRHVRNVYRALDRPIPDELFVTNITTVPSAAEIQKPTGFIRPVIDGLRTSYFEWLGSGVLEPAAAGGAMHQVSERSGLSLVEFGFDLERLFLKIEASRPMDRFLDEDATLQVRFVKPDGRRLEIGRAGGSFTVIWLRRGDTGRWMPEPAPAGFRAAVDRIVELEIPFAALGAAAGDPLSLFVTVARGGAPVEQQPPDRPIELEVPDRAFAAANWTA